MSSEQTAKTHSDLASIFRALFSISQRHLLAFEVCQPHFPTSFPTFSAECYGFCFRGDLFLAFAVWQRLFPPSGFAMIFPHFEQLFRFRVDVIRLSSWFDRVPMLKIKLAKIITNMFGKE